MSAEQGWIADPPIEEYLIGVNEAGRDVDRHSV